MSTQNPREVPVRMRIGDGQERQIGSLTDPDEISDLLRGAADEIDAQRQQKTAPHNRQIRHPGRDR